MIYGQYTIITQTLLTDIYLTVLKYTCAYRRASVVGPQMNTLNKSDLSTWLFIAGAVWLRGL